MELKMKYHHSVFIYPYVIKENKYNGYIERLAKSDKFETKLFEMEKDLSIYNFFLPNIRNYYFNSFEYAKNKDVRLEDKKQITKLMKSSGCTIFEYNIGKDAQAKVEGGEGIFFKIQKIEIICFKTGICFLAIKTNIEDTDRFSDILNFNVKFRDINSEVNGSEAYGNIKIQTSTFSDIKKLSDIIREIAGNRDDAKKIDVDVNRFLLYSYVCIDQEYWNEDKPFSNIEKEFYKFSNVLNSEFNSSFNNERLKTASLGNYIKVGCSKNGMSFLTSSINTANYTTLPFEFENQFFYTYILALYEKLYFSKLLHDFSSNVKIQRAVKKFAEFTEYVWNLELTNDDNGIFIFENAKQALELDMIYNKVKEQYDVMYKNFKMKNSDILNKIILVLLAASIVTNIVNFINLYKIK